MGDAVRVTTESLQGEGGRDFLCRTAVPAEVRGGLLVLHGYAEHSGMYEGVLRHFAAGGWAGFAPHLRGHGPGQRTLADVDSLEGVLADLRALHLSARRRVPAGPFFLIGHSMGGLVALLYALRHQQEVSGLVLSAPLARIPDYASPLLIRLSRVMAAVAPRLPVQAFDFRTVSHDPAVVEALAADPLYYKGRLRFRTGFQILQAVGGLQEQLPRLTLPVLLLQGEQDRTVELEATELILRRVSSADRTRRVLPGFRHVLFQGSGSEGVLEEISRWLEAHRG